MKLRDLPLSTRITASAMILVAMGALTLLFVEEAHLLRNVYFGQQRTHLENAFRTSDMRLRQAFDTLRRDALFLANTPPITGIMRAAQNNGFDPRDGNTRQQWEMRLQQIFSPFLAAHSEYSQVSYVGVADHGREILRLRSMGGRVEAVPPARLESVAEREYYAATLKLPPGRVRLSECCLDREAGAEDQPVIPAIYASVPVFAADGTIFGMIVLAMDLRPLLAATVAGLPPEIVTFVANRHGQYLLPPQTRQDPVTGTTGGETVSIRFPALARLFELTPPHYLPLQQMDARPMPQYLAGGRIHYDADQPAHFLLLAYHVPTEMSRRFTSIPRHHIATGFVVLLLACVAVLATLRRTFSPLAELTTAAAAITAGQRDLPPLPPDQGGEIGSLTAAISTMLTELSRREQEIGRINAGLEKQVAKRTQELTVANDRLVKEIGEREGLLHEVDTLLQRNQVLMQTAMDGIHLLDTDGNLVEANAAFCRMLGYSQEELAGRNVADWDARWAPAELLQHFRELIGKSILIETVHRRRDGTTFEVEIACSGVEIGGKGYVYAASRDISERKRAEAAMKQHQVILETARDGFWLTDVNGVLLEANEAYAQMSGYAVEKLVGMHVSQLEAREQSRQEVMAHIAKLIEDGYERFETRHRHKDGHEIDVEISTTFLPEAQRFFVFCRDITERKRASLELQHQQEMLNEAQRLGKLGSWELEVESGSLRWSDEVYRIFELDPARFAPSYELFLQAIHPKDRELVDQAYRQSLQNYQPYNIEHRLLFGDGRIKWVREHCTSTFDHSGRPLRSVGMVQDITERKRTEEEIRILALHDHLTGLPNCRYFLERLRAALAASARHGDYGAVLFVDLDRFKAINDTYGHEEGDLLLIEVARRLHACLRDIDTASRFGGDEFVVLIEELGSEDAEALRRAGLVAEKIRESLAQPYRINGHEHHSSPSIGVALYRGREDSMDTLLQRADTAMYQAKNTGRNKVCFFDRAVTAEG